LACEPVDIGSQAITSASVGVKQFIPVPSDQERATMKTLILSLIAASLTVTAMPAQAQYRGNREQRAENADQRADLGDRIADLDARIVAAQGSGNLERREALSLRRQLSQMKRYYTKSVRSRGFMSAAESASYGHTLDDIEAKLPDSDGDE
jgi:Ni/Co efflux regulator RcnB